MKAKWRESTILPKCSCGQPAPYGKRKCIKCLDISKFKVTQGKSVTKGSNARGIAAHKPDRSRYRKPKRQNPQIMGEKPFMVSAIRMKPERADRKPNEEVW